jgi:hypothetical protein
MATKLVEYPAMHEIEKLIVFAQLTAQGYPQDYIEGFVDALAIDTAAGDARASQLLAATIAQARNSKHPGLIGDVIETALQVLTISEIQRDLQRKVEATARLYSLLDIKEAGIFGSRIAYRKLCDAASRLKSETC